MEQTPNLVQVSEFLSFVLRHKPQAIGLALDGEGWASIPELIEKAQSQIQLSKSLIEQAVETNGKQRFAISEDKQYIRANQGHSIDVDLKLEPKQPPNTLYHGTAIRFLDSIMKEGLKTRTAAVRSSFNRYRNSNSREETTWKARNFRSSCW